MKNFIVFSFSVLLVAFPIVFAQPKSDAAAGGAVVVVTTDIIDAVVSVAAVAAAVASSKSDVCHTC